ncbi:MAG: 1-acyl-sn-glycerol-3-phosphate acyltransferase [Chitinophagales bacterium]|jgi:glycerol-3-phosphate O-acyltransferase|nr:1-acyl-sn-glycerol-3-phosphate acyltransferase [Chitinophagales bacterium]
MTNTLRTLLPLEFVEKKVSNWRIFRLTQDKEAFIKEIVADLTKTLLKKYSTNKSLYEEIASTLYLEKIRMSSSRWKADAKDQKDFWNKVKSQLLQIKSDPNWENNAQKELVSILRNILYRNAYEIVGHFNPSIFNFTQKLLPFLFALVFNSKIGHRLKKGLLSRKKAFYEKFRIFGDFELIRNVSKNGTLIFVPTHFCNTDSPIVGYAINSIGIDPVIYGAGLNLFGVQPLSFLMENLGAYKLDRRKKNNFYLETLKAYSRIAIERGTHSLFYPGGTRSRSGALEKKLKLGLLSTAIEAQQNNFEKNGQKIFVVPLIISYNFNIESSSLIHQHLTEIGKEKYVSQTFQYSTTYKILRFVKQFFSSDSEICLSFGPPMDVLGHRVDSEGRSLTPDGEIFDIRGYFDFEETLIKDEQRNFEYTKLLGNKILDSYFRYNIVMPTHLVAFVYFQLLALKNKKLNLFELLLLPRDERFVDYLILKNAVKTIKTKLIELNQLEKLMLIDNIIAHDETQIIEYAIDNISLYNEKKIIFQDDKNNITTEDISQLYFYHNRLTGYNLEAYVPHN